MSRQAWNLIKHSKNFYVRTYRKAGNYLIISVILNLLLILTAYYLHVSRPEYDFYATSGITPPVQLSPLNTPNNSDKALLEPDPIDNNIIKPIPE